MARVRRHLPDSRTHLNCYGQLFHGNLTSLLLLEADVDMIAAYCREIVAVIEPLSPLLIYFHQDDVGRAIHVVSTQRGEKWVHYQVNWSWSRHTPRGAAWPVLTASSLFNVNTVYSLTNCMRISISQRSVSRTHDRGGQYMTTSLIAR